MNLPLTNAVMDCAEEKANIDADSKRYEYMERAVRRVFVESERCASGWTIRYSCSDYSASMGFLRKNDGWSEGLVGQLVRLINEGLPL